MLDKWLLPILFAMAALDLILCMFVSGLEPVLGALFASTALIVSEIRKANDV